MAKKRVFITRSILDDGPNLLRSKGYEVDISLKEGPLTYEELKNFAPNYDALITMLSDQIDEEFLNYNKHLKVISNYAVGFNNINITKAAELNISIGNTSDVLTEATAELALGLMISASRQFHTASSAVANGRWKNWHPTEHLGYQLRGKNLGIIGFGRIGLRLAEMAHLAFKMNILYTSQTEKPNHINAIKVTQDDLLKNSDFISIHLPLTSETKNILSTNQFSIMRKNAVLVNTSRGEVIDQTALIDALKSKRIFAAGLDVMTPEPLPISSELNSLDNIFILPHIGSATYEARKEMSLLAAKNIIAGLEGHPLPSAVNTIDKTN